MSHHSDPVYGLARKNRERLDRARKWFELCTMFLEADDLESSAGMAQKIANELTVIRDELKRDYASVLLDRKLSTLNDDKSKVDELVGKKINDEPPADYAEIIHRLYADLRKLEKDSYALYPRPPWFAPMINRFWTNSPLAPLFKRYRRQFAMAAGVLIFIGLIAAFVRYQESRRHGLVGTYYADKNLKKQFKVRIDKTIDFDWGQKGPFRRLGGEGYSVSWTGYLMVDNPGRYELTTQSDDGCSLWIDDVEVISDWRDHGREYRRQMVDLNEGPHRIRLDYYQNKGDAAVRLMWRLEKEIQATIIPAENLYTEERFLPKTGS
jgi:hypothetical protein